MKKLNFFALIIVLTMPSLLKDVEAQYYIPPFYTFKAIPYGEKSNKPEEVYYCVNCGESYSSAETLLSSSCYKSPYGPYMGYHVLYEGSIKEKYTCKYCGEQNSSFSMLVNSSCSRHPAGCYRGNHSPAL